MVKEMRVRDSLCPEVPCGITYGVFLIIGNP
jgi:hypothetical protein